MRNILKTLFRESIDKYIGERISVNDIFKNNNLHDGGYNSEIMQHIDVYTSDAEFKTNPIEWVDVKLLVPTQRFIKKTNLKGVNGIRIGHNTGAFMVEYNGLYYIIDGHHRITNQIVNGADKIKGYVYHV